MANYMALLNDPMVPGGKIGFVQDGDFQIDCHCCGKTISITKPKLYPVQKIACETPNCQSELNSLMPTVVTAVKEDVVSNVNNSENNTEQDELTAFTEMQEVNDVKVIEKVANCPSCGGPRKGRGYTHTDENCPESTAAKLKAKQSTITSKPTCPVCGGPRKGRGYSHKTEGCSGVA